VRKKRGLVVVIPIAKPLIGNAEKQAVQDVLDSGQLAQGRRVLDFERRFATFCGVEYAVAVSSGTAALHLALLAHGIGPGDEVITTPFTFVATANAILSTGAKPVFVDIEPETFNINPDLIEDKVTYRTKAILPVHLFGHPCDMGAITNIAELYNLDVIEDVCQAHGASFYSRKVGAFGTGCFSFYATKNMTTGEGGMVTTYCKEVAERLRMLRNHGSRKRYIHVLLGYNYRMTEIQAAIGVEQLKKMPHWTPLRIRNAIYLTEKLKSLSNVVLPVVREGCVHVFHQYTIRVKSGRDAAARALKDRGIGIGIYYPLSINKQLLYQRLGYDCIEVPEAERACNEVLSLPVHPSLSREDLDKVVEAVREL
ncbi:unnamed protein product, partial [marine sediment metagenome]